VLEHDERVVVAAEHLGAQRGVEACRERVHVGVCGGEELLVEGGPGALQDVALVRRRAGLGGGAGAAPAAAAAAAASACCGACAAVELACEVAEEARGQHDAALHRRTVSALQLWAPENLLTSSCVAARAALRRAWLAARVSSSSSTSSSSAGGAGAAASAAPSLPAAARPRWKSSRTTMAVIQASYGAVGTGTRTWLTRVLS
jgi:hypothetical protein